MAATTQDAFSAMRGHVIEDMRVTMRDGTNVFVKPAWHGWRVVDPMGIPLRSCPSAAELECVIANYDGRWT